MIDPDLYLKLANYCAYQERCPSDVKQKFNKLKADIENYPEYIIRLKEENYLNEERYTKYFVQGHEKKKWGKTEKKLVRVSQKISDQ